MKLFYKFTTIILIVAAITAPSLLAKGNKEVVENSSTQKEQTVIEFRTISAEEAKAAIDSQDDIIIVDVRTPGEYSSGHIKDSINIPLNTIEDTVMEKYPNRDTKLYLYCRSGNRSSQAARLLVKQGYTNVVDFGGINNWPYEIVQ